MNAYVVVSLLTGARTEELRGVDLVAGQSRRQPADHRALEICPSTRRHEDEQVTPHTRVAGPLRRSPDEAPLSVEKRAPKADASSRSSISYSRRPPAPRLIPQTSAEPSGASSPRLGWTQVLDTERAAAQLRLAAIQLRDADRRHRPPRRPCQHPGHRTRVPRGATSGADPRSGRDGCALSRRRGLAHVGKQIGQQKPDHQPQGLEDGDERPPD